MENIDFEKEQRELDRQKYLKSEWIKVDMSGIMPYCEHCMFQDGGRCVMNHENRAKFSVCGRNNLKVVKVINELKQVRRKKSK